MGRFPWMRKPMGEVGGGRRRVTGRVGVLEAEGRGSRKEECWSHELCRWRSVRINTRFSNSGWQP